MSQPLVNQRYKPAPVDGNLQRLPGFNSALAACGDRWAVVLSLLAQWRSGHLAPGLRRGQDGETPMVEG